MHRLEHRQKITIMVAIMAAMLFAALNNTIVSTALPRIVADLGGMEYFSWVFTIYLLASTVPAVVVGKLSDIYGRKPFILIGIAIFILGSVLSGLATSIIQLILFRAVQGTGAGVVMATAFTAVGDLFPPRERGKWQGMLASMFGVASVFGPTLGGYIVDHFHWKWVFWVFIPVGFVAFAMIWSLFPKVEKRPDQSIDYLGSLLLMATIIPMLLAFSWAGQKYDWLEGQILALSGTAIVALIAFVYIERRTRHPVLPLVLFKNSVFTVSNIVSFVTGASMFSAVMYLPFFLQGVLATTATTSGYIMAPMTLSLVVSSIFAGRLMTRTGRYKSLGVVGVSIVALGMYFLSRMTADTSVVAALRDVVFVGLGFGICMPVFTLSVQNSVDHQDLGVATASVQLFRQLGGTIGVAVMGSVLSLRMATSVDASIADSGNRAQQFISELPETAQAAMNSPELLVNPERLAALQSSVPDAVRPAIENWLEIMRGALETGISSVFLAAALAMLLALGFTFLLREVPLRTTMHK